MTAPKSAVRHPLPQRAAYSIEEARQLLGGIGNATIYEEINAGRFRSFKIARRRLISEHAIRDYIAAAERETSAAKQAATETEQSE